MADLYKF